MTTVLVCLTIYVVYRYSERIAHWIGPTGTAIVMRISAFLLFCIGVQVLWTGVAALATSLRAG